jgi:hypothetical protein
MSVERVVEVSKINIDGKKYALDKKTNTIYDLETAEAIGKYDSNFKKINYFKTDVELENKRLKRKSKREAKRAARFRVPKVNSGLDTIPEETEREVEKEEKGIYFSSSIGDYKVGFTKPTSEEADELPLPNKELYVSVDMYSIGDVTDIGFKYVVSKLKEEAEAKGVLVFEDEDEDGETDDNIEFIPYDDVNQFIVTFGIEGYKELAEEGYAAEIEQEEDEKVTTKKKQTEPVKQLPYPEELQFTEEELTIFNRNRSDIDKSAREYIQTYLRGDTGRVIIYKDKAEGYVIEKRALQIEWDEGNRNKEQEFDIQNKEYIKNFQRNIEIINNMTAEYQKTKDKSLKEEIKKAKALLKIVEEEYGKFRQAENDRLDEIQIDKEEEDYRERVRQNEEDKRRNEEEKEQKRLAEEARLKEIEDKKKEEKAARKEAALVPLRKQFKKEIIDPTLKETGITGRINLNMIDVENRTALYYPTQNIWYNPEPNERRTFSIRNPEPNERATGDKFLGQAKDILRKLLVKLLLYKKIGENSKSFKIDLNKWVEMNEALGIEDDYEYYVTNMRGGLGDNQKYGVIYTRKSLTKEELVRDKWKEPLKVRLRISSELFDDNFFLQTLDKMGEDGNLPPFQEKTGGKVVALGVQAEKIPKQDEIWKWSNPVKVAEMAKKYLGDMAVVFRSTKPKKKYMIFDPENNKWVFFGEMGYEDFTKHQDPKRRENYLTRTASMKGNWKNNKYSANNLSRNILW